LGHARFSRTVDGGCGCGEGGRGAASPPALLSDPPPAPCWHCTHPAAPAAPPAPSSPDAVSRAPLRPSPFFPFKSAPLLPCQGALPLAAPARPCPLLPHLFTTGRPPSRWTACRRCGTAAPPQRGRRRWLRRGARPAGEREPPCRATTSETDRRESVSGEAGRCTLHQAATIHDNAPRLWPHPGPRARRPPASPPARHLAPGAASSSAGIPPARWRRAAAAAT
jgi:hypothetical protein